MKYEDPKMEVVMLLTADIITLSGGGDGGDIIEAQSLQNDWM